MIQWLISVKIHKDVFSLFFSFSIFKRKQIMKKLALPINDFPLKKMTIWCSLCNVMLKSHTYFSSYCCTVAFIETTSKPSSGAFVHFPSYISFASLSLPFYTFSLVGYIAWPFSQSFKKREINCYVPFFFFYFSPSHTHTHTHTHTLSLSLFLWSFPAFKLAFYFVGHSNEKERYYCLLICLQGCLLPICFHSRSSITMRKCMHVCTEIKSWSTIKNNWKH
jgi:hypothetical protein